MSLNTTRLPRARSPARLEARHYPTQRASEFNGLGGDQPIKESTNRNH